MPYLIDGSNLGGVLGGAAGSRDRLAVIRRLLPWVRRGRKVTVIFDGAPDPSVAKSYGGLRVGFSGAGSADDEIRRRVKNASDWLVVTNDRALARDCRGLGAEVLSVDELLSQLDAGERSAAPSESEDPRVDVELWEEYFRRG